MVQNRLALLSNNCNSKAHFGITALQPLSSVLSAKLNNRRKYFHETFKDKLCKLVSTLLFWSIRSRQLTEEMVPLHLSDHVVQIAKLWLFPTRFWILEEPRGFHPRWRNENLRVRLLYLNRLRSLNGWVTTSVSWRSQDHQGEVAKLVFGFPVHYSFYL